MSDYSVAAESAPRSEYENDTRRYTYADYLTWEGPERYQLLGGKAYMMSSPSVTHQGILMELSRQFSNFLLNKPCRVFAAPLDVRLFPKDDNSDDTVVQPDLLVVCDNGKIAKGSINGGPDLAVEVVSPSNTEKELLLKLSYYLEAGVREYWVIFPDEKRAQVYIYDNGRYIASAYRGDAVIEAAVLPGLGIDLTALWALA